MPVLPLTWTGTLVATGVYRKDFEMEWDARHAAPKRGGSPWTDDDHELLIHLVQEDERPPELASRLERSEQSVLQRLRRLLPLEHRGCPVDRLYPAAQSAFADSNYDWKKTVLLSPAPRPVTMGPTIERHGVEGLEDHDLTTIAFALAQTGGARCAEVLERVSVEVPTRRGVFNDIVRLAGKWLQRHHIPVAEAGPLRAAAADWILASDGWRDAHEPEYPLSGPPWADAWSMGSDYPF